MVVCVADCMWVGSYGMVRYGTVYSMVWYGIVWYGIEWHDVVGMVWNGMVWFGVVRYVAVRYGTAVQTKYAVEGDRGEDVTPSQVFVPFLLNSTCPTLVLLLSLSCSLSGMNKNRALKMTAMYEVETMCRAEAWMKANLVPLVHKQRSRVSPIVIHGIHYWSQVVPGVHKNGISLRCAKAGRTEASHVLHGCKIPAYVHTGVFGELALMQAKLFLIVMLNLRYLFRLISNFSDVRGDSTWLMLMLVLVLV